MVGPVYFKFNRHHVPVLKFDNDVSTDYIHVVV